jgi:hypothetical protein
MLTRHPLQVWLGLVLVWLIYLALHIWAIDALPSPRLGSQQLLPHSSLCYEGNDFAVSFVVTEMGSSPLIRIAMWGRDMRIVVLTGSFFLANLAGMLYGKAFSIPFRLVFRPFRS